MKFIKILTFKRNFSKKNVSLDVYQNPIKMSYKTYDKRLSNFTPLVVIHGLLASKLTWKSICTFFNDKTQPARKIIAVDLRDHGESPHTNFISYPQIAEDIKTFLTERNIQKSCFLGHCFGGRGLLLFGLKYPDYVDKMIIADASTERATPFKDVVPEILKHLQKVDVPQEMSIIESRAKIKKQLEGRIRDTRLLNFILTNLYKKSDGSIAWRINIDGILNNFRKNLLYFPKESKNVFKGSVLFINGENSNFLIQEDHKNILNMFPNAKFYTIKGAGHWVHADKPTEFVNVCLQFLNKYD